MGMYDGGGNLLCIPEFDTPKDSQVSVSLDIGIVPAGYPGAGQHIITIQAWPIPRRDEAEKIAAAMREAIGSRLQISFERQRGVG
jgi:hypothetical protein